ncbi:MAG: GNAT family N-acetyltransferase [Candidatus Bathyarchaeia archaeon]
MKFEVRTMSSRDFGFAVQITNTAGWGLVKEDFEFMRGLEPEGCFILLADGKRIGIATTISFGKVGWVGNVIVGGAYRKKGAGAMLVRRCVDFLKTRGVRTVGLYAYMDTVSFYEKLGFRCDSEFLFMKKSAVVSAAQVKPSKAANTKLEEIVKFDNACFGASRKKLLEPMLKSSNSFCYAKHEDKKIVGYVVSTVYDGKAELGPLVCRQDRSGSAVALLKAVLLDLAGFEVSACVQRKDVALVKFLKDSGFEEVFSVMRMFQGPVASKECIYFAESLERG